MTDNALRAAMASKAAARKDPAFHEAQEELVHKLNWATMMRDAGRLSKKEFQEFESHLTAAYLDAMPVETFVEMQKDGRYSDLETIARRIDDKNDSYDVLAARKKLEAKITQDALDEALSSNKIDARRYNEEHRKLGVLNDDMTRRVTDAGDDGDHDTPAYETFFERNLPPGDTAPIESPKPDGGPKDASED